MLSFARRLLTLPFDGVEARFAAPPLFCGIRSCVLGKAELGADAWIGGSVCIRADGHFIRIGDRFWIGDRSTVHIAHDLHPAIVGNRVTVGRNSVVHACTVGEDCVIEDDVVILDASVVGEGVLIEAGSLVLGASELSAGSVYAGAPATRVRSLDRSELDERRARVQRLGSHLAWSSSSQASVPDTTFAALTAELSGQIEIGAGASVFFGCDLSAGGGRIVIGENTNIQDNTVISCSGGDAVIGRDTTLGHNVRVGTCRIGHRALIGIGAVLADATVVEEDVLVGAGATTSPGQTLESGWFWAGRPARAIAPLDERKRLMMARTIEQYCGYARSFRVLQLRAGANGRALQSSLSD